MLHIAMPPFQREIYSKMSQTDIVFGKMGPAITIKIAGRLASGVELSSKDRLADAASTSSTSRSFKPKLVASVELASCANCPSNDCV